MALRFEWLVLNEEGNRWEKKLTLSTTKRNLRLIFILKPNMLPYAQNSFYSVTKPRQKGLILPVSTYVHFSLYIASLTCPWGFFKYKHCQDMGAMSWNLPRIPYTPSGQPCNEGWHSTPIQFRPDYKLSEAKHHCSCFFMCSRAWNTLGAK